MPSLTRLSFALCAAVLLPLGGAAARAQAPLFLVDEQTQVRSVSFRFLDTRSFAPGQLQEQIATTPPRFMDRGLIGSVRARLPLFGQPAPYPFDPVEVQRDLVRLQRYYQRNGFPRPAVDYLARLDTSDNRISVLFTIEEGPEILIADVRFVGEDAGRLLPTLPPDLHADWQRFRRSVDVRQGRRLDDFALVSLQGRTLGWLQERGYAFAEVGAERFVDSTGLAASVQIKVALGPRALYGAIEVQGAESVRDRVVLRELPFGPGDRFRASELAEGRREVFGLNLFQLALVDVAPEQPRDSTVDVLVRVREAPRRVVNAYTGYLDRGGLTGRLQFTHRNFLGDARSFTASAEARSGFLGTVRVAGAPITDYSATLSLRQPYVFHRQLSAGTSLLGRSRNDEIERSDQVEAAASLLFERAPLQTAALATSINYRVLRFEEGRSFGLLDPDILGDDLRATTAALDLSATYGVVDAPLQPRQGFILRPGVRLATPPFTDVPHLRARGVVTGFLPFGRTGSFVGRLSGGYLVPFAGTDPDNLRDYLLLRDQYFFAGGTQDVRGWGETRLGPKLFDLLFVENDPDTAEDDEIITLGYFGLGGLGRVSGSLQANVPVRDRLGASFFVDGGQVLRPAQAYTNALFLEPEFDFFRGVLDAENGFRVGTGVGVQYLTPVGFINVALGFKVNPSFLDVRPATVLSNIFRRQLFGEPVSLSDYDDDARFLRRFQLHFSIGQTF